MLPLYDKIGCFFDEIVCETKKISNFVIGLRYLIVYLSI